VVIGLTVKEILKVEGTEAFPSKVPDNLCWYLWLPNDAEMAADVIFERPNEFILFVRSAAPDLFPKESLPPVRLELIDGEYGALPVKFSSGVRTACESVIR
jgi:hypothetical protein